MKKNLLVCIKLASALFHHKTVPFRKQLEHSTKSKLCVGFPQTSDDDLAIESIPEDFKDLNGHRSNFHCMLSCIFTASVVLVFFVFR